MLTLPLSPRWRGQLNRKMRCKNCGWENPAGVSKCEKCNASISAMEPLGAPLSAGAASAPAPAPIPEPAISLKGTVPDSQIFGSSAHPSICPQCNYPIGNGMNSCPNCGKVVATPSEASAAPVHSAPKEATAPILAPLAITCQHCGAKVDPQAKFCASCGQPLKMATVNPWATPQPGTVCSLRPLAWENETVEYAPLSYSGEKIELNRANTDPNNQTITSQLQAEIVWEEGEWYITNKSAQKSTYIQVGERTPLKDGDVILMGNRRFEFKG